MKALPTLPAFGDFFHQLWGKTAFPWQERLAEKVTAEGAWPAVLALPTAAGKTAAQDIAIWHLAASAELPVEVARAARRIFFIVDRRVVVDEAFERARLIAQMLRDAPPSQTALYAVAERLRTIGGISDEPLRAVLLRGGIYRDTHWVRDVAQPLICVSTVDQVGSRILFRGYGVAPGARPIHAALTSHDALFLLDEAHLSNPFYETLTTINYEVRGEPHRGFNLPFSVCQLSATPNETDGVFTENEDDRRHPVLGFRLKTEKLALLDEVRTKKPSAKSSPHERRELEINNRSELVARATDWAQRLCSLNGVKVIALIFNEVATARAAHEALRATGQTSILLIGRSRPFDRWRLLESPPQGQGESLSQYLKTGPQRTLLKQPLFVVATQCIEVGADFDFDTLVTECASLDALRQRFGRLARQGRSEPAPAVILGRADQVARGKDHFLYGTALAETWAWLNDPATCVKRTHPLLPNREKSKIVDFGHLALATKLPVGDQLSQLIAPKPTAPLLLEHHLDSLARTRPSPLAEPEATIFLHGPEANPPDLQVVWRADIDPSDEQEVWRATLNALPPVSGEALPLPIHALRKWLFQAQDSGLSDAEGEQEEDKDQRRMQNGTTLRCPIGIWNSEGELWLVRSTQDVGHLGPGHTVIIPAVAGGCDQFGWNPDSEREVTDLAEVARLVQRRELALRLHPAVWKNRGWSAEAARSILDEAEEIELKAQELRALTLDALPSSGDALFELHLQALRNHLPQSTGWKKALTLPSSHASNNPSRLLRRQLPRDPANPLATGTLVFPEDDEASILLPGEEAKTTLSAHTDTVVRAVRSIAGRLGLSKALAEDLALAAAWHDLGKADPRFQLRLDPTLNQDSQVGDSRELLAKSISYDFSGELDNSWPKGARHEALSLELVRTHRLLDQLSHDPELVLHLIAAHHGWARPLFPAPAETEATVVKVNHETDSVHLMEEFVGQTGPHLYRLDNGVADRFFGAQGRHGRYGLAFLETILRLADWKASGGEERI